MNLEQRVEALEKKLDAFFANEYPRVRNIVDKREEEWEDARWTPTPEEIVPTPPGYDKEAIESETPLVIHGQGEYAKKIYPSDLK